jgi:uncharacterized tellurite resistance protein B-like protein
MRQLFLPWRAAARRAPQHAGRVARGPGGRPQPVGLARLAAGTAHCGMANDRNDRNDRDGFLREAIRRIFNERMALPVKPNGHGRFDGVERAPVALASASQEARQAAEDERQRLHVAACALLLEIAYADDHFSDSERAHICAVMQRHFDLDQATARLLIELAEAERDHAIDLYQFASLVREQYDLGQKTLLAEIMWGLVLTDGAVQRHESWMLRRIAKLLDLAPGYLSFAKKNAAQQVGD